MRLSLIIFSACSQKKVAVLPRFADICIISGELMGGLNRTNCQRKPWPPPQDWKKNKKRNNE